MFAANPQPRAIDAGRLYAKTRKGDRVPPGAALSQGDAITHIVHRHEPSISHPAVRVVCDSNDIVAVCKSTLPVHPSGRCARPLCPICTP